MKKLLNLVAGLTLTGAGALPLAAPLPAVQRSGFAPEATLLPAVQSGWLVALLTQLQAIFGT